MVVVYAIHPIYEGDKIYVAYDSEYWNNLTGDEKIKNEMVVYCAELKKVKR